MGAFSQTDNYSNKKFCLPFINYVDTSLFQQTSETRFSDAAIQNVELEIHSSERNHVSKTKKKIMLVWGEK